MRVGGENHRAVISDGDGVLVVRGGQVVVGRDDPTIGARTHMIDPIVTIGSMAMTIPARRRTPLPFFP